MNQNLLRTVVAAGLAFALVGCAKPRVIQAITGRQDQMKFLYVEGNDQGIVRCKVNPDGSLTQCANVSVALEED
jgi:phosphoribosylformylglycinamidine (FGAM) synthase-like amidotransferase family enzyme